MINYGRQRSFGYESSRSSKDNKKWGFSQTDWLMNIDFPRFYAELSLASDDVTLKPYFLIYHITGPPTNFFLENIKEPE